MRATETRDVGSRRNAAPLLGTMATVTTPTVRPGIAERLSQMIRIPTVSAELEERGPAPFEEFVALIAELYPLTHEKLGLERHTDFGLLFHWEGNGATSDEPVVLMAHYDVVPVDESDGWTHPPFAGVIADGSVYGRGALDDKGPLIVVLEAVENLLADGFVPPVMCTSPSGATRRRTGAPPSRSRECCANAGWSRGSWSTRVVPWSTRPCPSSPAVPR